MCASVVFKNVIENHISWNINNRHVEYCISNFYTFYTNRNANEKLWIFVVCHLINIWRYWYKFIIGHKTARIKYVYVAVCNETNELFFWSA